MSVPNVTLYSRVALSWLISLLGISTILVAILWISIMLASGFAMGWGGRSSLQIITLLFAGLIMPCLLTIFLARNAVAFSRKDQNGRASAWLLASFAPIPTFYLVVGL